MSSKRQFYTAMDDNTEVAKWKNLEVPDLPETLQEIIEETVPALLIAYNTTFPEVGKEVMSLEVSFEAGEQTSQIIRFPSTATITKIRAFVTKELSDTNAGTITATLDDGTTPITDGAISIPAESAVGTERTATPTALNTVEAGEYILLQVVKIKDGGRARVTIEYTLNDLSDIRKNTVGLEVSFEDGEAITHTLYFPNKVTINTIKAFVTAELAATDNATITAKNNAGTGMANGVITLLAESAVGTEGTASPTTNNVLTAGQKIQLAAAKTTPGGRARVTISYTVTD